MSNNGEIQMTSRATAPIHTTISIPAGRLAITAIVAYQILLIALIFLRPDLDPSWHTISEWEIGRYGWLMSGALVISGLSYAALLVMLASQVRGAHGPCGNVHSPDMRGRCVRRGRVYDRSHAHSPSPVYNWDTSRHIRNQPVGAASIRSPVH
jgi:hypothetical protein